MSDAISWSQGGFSQKVEYLICISIHKICTIKLFVNRGQVKLVNGKTTDSNSYYSKHNQKLKFLICNLSLVYMKRFCTVFLAVLKWVEWFPIAMFTHDITKCKKDERCH